MKSLDDVAESGPDVVLTSGLVESVFALQEMAVYEADDVSPDGEFPQYGEFLRCDEFSPTDGTERGETYVECPAALARWLVDEADVGDRWQVTEAEKIDDEWQITAEIVRTDDQRSLETAAAAMDGSDSD